MTGTVKQRAAAIDIVIERTTEELVMLAVNGDLVTFKQTLRSLADLESRPDEFMWEFLDNEDMEMIERGGEQ